MSPEAQRKDRPILFSGPMVRAILAGRKTQTRRVVKPQPPANFLRGDVAPITDGELWAFGNSGLGGGERGAWPADPAPGFPCPYGQPGDRLWVRETFAPNTGTAGGFLYRADHHECAAFYRLDLKPGRYTHAMTRWKPSIFCTRDASRITLNVTAVRVERLQDISEDDAEAEGVEETMGKPQVECDGQVLHYPDASFVKSYRSLWESINGPGSWDANPWVWVISFQPATPPTA